MSESWENPDYDYLKGRRPTDRQLRHLKEDLLYEGPEITDAFEASQLIDILRADPVVRAKQQLFHRMRSGPEWIAWEKWMSDIGRKEHDKRHWHEWWERTRDLALAAGVDPPQRPPLPSFCQGGRYHSPENLLSELHGVFGLPASEPIRIELSAATREEALLARDEICRFRESLAVIDNDCEWMQARIRGGDLSDEELWDLFRESGGETVGFLPIREVKKHLVNCYGVIRTMIRDLKKQMAMFRRRLKEVYRV